MDPSFTLDFVAPEWFAFSAVIAFAAFYVALDLAKRVRSASSGVALRRLALAALSMGTGVWSAYTIAAMAFHLSFPVGYSGAQTFGVWLAASLMCMACLALLSLGTPSWLRLALVCLFTGTSFCAVQRSTLLSMGLRPGIDWDWPTQLAAWAIALLGSALAFSPLMHRRVQAMRLPRRLQMASAAILALTVIACQRVSAPDSAYMLQAFSAFDNLIPAKGMTLLASVGTGALLVLIWITSLLETHMKRLLRNARQDLHKQALVDLLTGLPNRLHFEVELAKAMRDADVKRGRVALLFIGLDGFKSINESYGHNNGDRMLCEMAERLRSSQRPTESLARLGADEFLLLIADNPGNEDARHRAEELLDLLGEPCRLDGRESSVTCSIGIAAYPEHGDLSSLISSGEAATRYAKSLGGSVACVFEPRMLGGVRDRVDLLLDLRRAVANNELELYYQPKIHAPSGEITGAEALLRWNHPERGMVSPTVFVPLAERFGLINAIGDWVIAEACRQTRAWRDQGLRMRIAINLSVHQMRRSDLAERIADQIERHRLNPKQLTCEITESVAMDDAEATMKVFERLASVGVHISIDDFGTGYSSLSYLRKLRAEELKIDRSFVLDLATSSDARAIVDAVIKLAQALGLKVVAEGVETEPQYRILRSLGCDELQGYLFAKPMTADAFSRWAMGDAGPRELEFRESLFGETMMTDLP